jgi:hypothetical protein
VLADAEGKFRVPVKKIGEYLFASHEGGFASIGPGNVESPLTIQLKAWGRIEGTVRDGGAPPTNVSFSLGSARKLPIDTRLADSASDVGNGVSPDRAGRFTFTNVAPGEYTVQRLVTIRNGSTTTSSGRIIAHLEVKAGEVTPLEVEDTGSVTNIAPPARFGRGFRRLPPQDTGGATNDAPSNSPPRVPPSSREPSNETSSITGTVLLPNGQLAAGAQVALEVSTYNWAKLSHAKLIWGWGAGIETATLPVNADQDGRFSFPPTKAVTAIVAVHERGYVRVGLKEFENGSKIALQPWARIEGVLRLGTRPGTNEQVVLSAAPALGGLGLDLQAFQDRTDRDGKFVFTEVPPGTWLISHGVEPPWDGDPITVEAGKTNHVTIGGTGRPVIGNLLIPSAVTNPPARAIVAATGNMFVYPDSTTKWTSHFVNVTLYGPGHEFAARMALDGTFRAEDVPAGTWWLLAEIYSNPGGAAGGQNKLIGAAGKTVVVPEMPLGRSDAPLDVGKVAPVMVHSLKIGEAAQPLEVKTEDGKTFKLADHRGQYVLLDFEPFYSTNEPNPSVQAVWAAFGKTNRLAMLTLEVPSMFADSYQLPRKDFPWPLSLLRKMPFYEQRPLRAGFGLQCDRSIEPDTNLPAVLLIGPDGKIAARGLRGAAIKTAVAAALAKK